MGNISPSPSPLFYILSYKEEEHQIREERGLFSLKGVYILKLHIFTHNTVRREMRSSERRLNKIYKKSCKKKEGDVHSPYKPDYVRSIYKHALATLNEKKWGVNHYRELCFVFALRHT